MNNHQIERLPIDSLSIERSMIGACIVNPDSAIEEASQVLTADDFYDDACQVWFAHLARLFAQGRPITSVSLQTEMKSSFARSNVNDWEFCGGANQFARLITEAAATAYAWTAKQIKFASNRRKLSDIGKRLIELSLDETIRETDELVSQSYAAFKAIEESGDALIADVTPIAKVCDEVEKRIVQTAYGLAEIGLPWPIHALTELAGPLQPHQLTVVAARPGLGKSSLAGNVAEFTAERGDRVLFLTLEMANVEIGERVACSMAGVDSSMLVDDRITAEERKAIALKLDQLRKYPIDLVDKSRITTSEISALVRVHHRKNPIKLLIIDYLKLILPDNPRDRRDQQVSQIVRDIKSIAKQMKIPILLLAQLSRSCEQENREPRMSDLAESASIEQDADRILVIHNPAHEGRSEVKAKDNENAHRTDPRSKQDVVFKLLKNRGGRLGKIDVKWYPSITRFEEMPIESHHNYHAEFATNGKR